MNDTKIEWADDTVNPWWGCVKVSRACHHCYAESLDARWHPDEKHWGPTSPRMIRIDKAVAELDRIAKRSDKEGRPRRVFIASMADVFEDRPDLVEPRKRLWDALFRLDGRLIPMLLTKRPEVMAAWAKEHGWPSSAWAGTTIEDEATRRARLPELLKVPAGVRFLSMEPLVEAVHVPLWALGKPRWVDSYWEDGGGEGREFLDGGINWVIAGGESGPHAQPSHPDWFRGLRDQCAVAGVPFFFKQWGEWGDPDDIDAHGVADSRYAEHYPEDGGVRRHSWPDAAIRETARRLGKGELGHQIGGDTEVFRVGKKAAGRLLDGVEHNGVPHV